MSNRTLESDEQVKVPATDIVIQGLESIIPPSFSPIEDLKQVVGKDGIITMVTDQFLLLNAERLKEVLGEDTYRAYISSLAGTAPSPMSQLRSKMSDDDLLDTVKSRYLQSPSEMRSYIQGLDDRLQELKASLEMQIAEIQQSAPASEGSSSE